MTLTADPKQVEAACRRASAAILEHIPLLVSETDADVLKSLRLLQAVTNVLEADAELRPVPTVDELVRTAFFEGFRLPARQ